VLRSPVANILLAAVAGAVFLTGLVLPGVPGGLVLLVVAAALATITRAAWPAIPPRGRRFRLAILTAVVAVALIKISVAK
jgi:hypothetical protein